MHWLLYIVFTVLALNLIVILLVGFVLVSDWMRNRARGPRSVVKPLAGGRRPGGPERP